MRRDRLERLKVVLNNVKPERFNMKRYYHDCGTPACAAGWATADRVLGKQGLTRSIDDVQFEGNLGYRGLAKFFDITLSQSANLFGPIHYNSDGAIPRSAVIAKIDELLNA